MIYIEANDSNIDTLVKSVCAPIFATDFLLETGHSNNTINATVTFVQFKSHVYAVTCHHVISAFQSEAVNSNRRIVPSIHSGNAVHQFGSFDQDGKYLWSFTSCREFPSDAARNNKDALEKLENENANRPDIAIADITDIWSLFQRLRGANAINLDNWVEPNWSDKQPVWMAYGFPNAHKYLQGNMVAAPMPRVSVELVSGHPTPEHPKFTLHSELMNEHGWGFSGISGGPVLVAHTTEERCAFVGITFEGTPSDKDIEKNPESFLGKCDILLSGYHLTPTVFHNWLSQLQFHVVFPKLA